MDTPAPSSDRTSRLELPPVGRVGLVEKGRLTLEVARSYPSLARSVRRNDLPAMARTARAAAGPTIAVPPSEAHQTAIRLGHIVMRTLRVMPTDSRCLIRSLLVLQMMTRRTIPGQLVVGVKSDDRFEAHAWVEHDARPVIPAGDFERLVEF